jgi:hypothetical protein
VRTAWAAAAALALAPLACESRPRAPALTPEAVYENDAAGVRFVVPEGWVTAGKTALPPGAFDRPIRLVSYSSTVGQAGLDLYAIDLPAGQDLPGYLERHAIGADKWVAKGPGQPDKVNGTPAMRYTQTAGKKGERTRELTAFARGGRTYVFVLSYATADGSSRDAGRRAVETTTWK